MSKKHHQILPGGPCEPALLLCLLPVLSSLQDPRPGQERAGTFLCWAGHSSALSSARHIWLPSTATAGWDQGWQEGRADLLAAACAEGTVLRGQGWPESGSHMSQPEAVSSLPAQGVAPYPELCRAPFPPWLPLWPLGHFGILVLFSFPETGGKLEAG